MSRTAVQSKAKVTSGAGSNSSKTEEIAAGVAEKVSAGVDSVVNTAAQKTRSTIEAAARGGQAQTLDATRAISRAIQAGSISLQNDGYEQFADYVHSTASKVESVADKINEKRVRGFSQDIEEYVRENPMKTFGGLAIAGFLVAGFLQSKNNS